jgi:hypothetical protein
MHALLGSEGAYHRAVFNLPICLHDVLGVNRYVQSQVRFTSSLEVNDKLSKFMSAKYSIDNVR